MKYVFVTGGVVSSLGKGLTAAALGTVLEHRGLKIALQKLDPYLNVDPGTMNPYQHGEVYVLEDGAETDLDLGHYERFTSVQLTRKNNATTGQIYESVIHKERRGDYLGKTVQVIPHVTDEIKERIRAAATAGDYDLLITEIGGTTGDIEGLPFLEAVRQLALEVGPGNALFLHVTLVPYLRAAGELKSKPTQQSVAKLREIGIQPNILVCRSEWPLTPDIRQKLSLYCSVPLEAVVEEVDLEHSIYELPLLLQRERLDELVARSLRLSLPPADLRDWQKFLHQILAPKYRVRIAMVGKYIEHQDAYKSVSEALVHAGASVQAGIELIPVDAEEVEKRGAEELLGQAQGIVVPGGFGHRGVQGKIMAARFARERKIPYLGLCLGMQIAVVEFARHVLDMPEAHSTEFCPTTSDPVICLLEEQRQTVQKGASMRLGASLCHLVPGTKSQTAYQALSARERHRHRYEFNNAYREAFERAGFLVGGTSEDTKLVELLELADHPWFVGCQFHPEFHSRPNAPHPLFAGFLREALRVSAG
ncbi:CTP synthase [Methylacidimicrobium tartarophylax]|uniref:CTP synthase n=1 Tax=Methylacidimicrobium tartarophylax TaxID=1041768 RepID=A0A5E6MPG4_9BACT|nr:CTP synthase [Methylacidimicrobium tartarophylax]VVM07888.1 CTP synthase [Methylacidimicrobium tartarophylax]